MDWIKEYVLRLSTVLVLSALSLGGLYARQETIIERQAQKADREPITRELNQINARIGQIDSKVDALLLRNK